MSNPYRDRLLGVGVISKRSGNTVREGREHPESGARWKSTTDEAGTTHVEHAKGDRVDAVVRPTTVRAVRVRRNNA
jgi:hypothetical protein